LTKQHPSPDVAKTRAPGVHVISRAEMAKRLGVSRAAVTRACREGGRLAPAVVGTGVNALADAARLWLAQRKAKTAALVGAAATLPPATTPIAVDEGEEPPPLPPAAELRAELGTMRVSTDLDDLAEPLTRLTTIYGDAREFERWVKCRKVLAEAQKAEMLRERIEGRLIARTTVVAMVDAAATAFRLLLSDSPRTIATRLSCPDMAAATALIRDVMSQALEAARDQMAAALDADDPMVPLAEAAE
jgi:hypothetical protein